MGATLTIEQNDHIQYIVELESTDCSVKLIDQEIESYQLKYGNFYTRDKNLYMHKFLKYIDILTAIHLYESMTCEGKNNLILAIHYEHKHLDQLIEIHRILHDDGMYESLIQSSLSYEPSNYIQ